MAKTGAQMTTMRAPYLRRVWWDENRVVDKSTYPFCLPIFQRGDFSIDFDGAVTIIVGENGAGKSTLLEGIAALAGYDEAGGGKGYRPVDHSQAVEAMGGQLAQALRGGWLPKVTKGWFFKAESFFSVSPYLDQAATESGGAGPDFLSHSHGEGFLRFFEERCKAQGLYIFDEPESALSPARQIEFLKLLRRMDGSGFCQVIMATHSPILMAYPGARLLGLSKYGLEPITLEQTQHFRLLREFCLDPELFIETMMDD
ncbi:AAA family ATPase [Microvirga alba]|uniref:AAA family ATPase n=1 Tax=Microvirga alba TaxID=2791025 RepID=A0A931BRB3_9HYPH|nr:AAA family ATPase [Microvirga alba]MBF9233193.1 AAA family ATPase [Microvirga alba]